MVDEEEAEQCLRAWASEAGLCKDSDFLVHWSGLAKAGEGATEDALPRPSPWNHFAKDVAIVDTEETPQCLRAWAIEAGLPEESKFLSHWFSLVKGEGATEDALPRPSPWNHFAKDAAILDM